MIDRQKSAIPTLVVVFEMNWKSKAYLESNSMKQKNINVIQYYIFRIIQKCKERTYRRESIEFNLDKFTKGSIY